jgi:hypothetical protein
VPLMDVDLRMHINVDQLVAEAQQAASSGLYKASEHVLTSASPKVPWQSGDLERSGDPGQRPGAIAVDEGNLRAAIGYDMPYAAVQHESLDYRHPIRGEPKWLETTLREEAENVRLIVAKEIRKALRG